MAAPRVLVTGASSGLGLHLVSYFQKKGHDVFSHMGKSHCDFSNIENIESFIKEVRVFSPEVLINNAAITCPNKLLQDYTSEEIKRMISVNLTVPILLVHGMIDQIKCVININSMVGLEIKPMRTLYSATKWGLRGFSQSFQEENQNIQVLDVFPTNIKTNQKKQNAMEVDFVLNKIYEAYSNNERRLVLDGRK